jgi:hypothetical protein
MSDVTTRRAEQHAPSAATEPFRFGASDGFAAGAKGFALMWTLPMRTMMVVLGEAMAPHRRR